MTMVFVHGAGGSSLGFYYQTRQFRESDAVDLPGHPEGKPCTSIEGYVQWVRSYIKGRGYQDVVLAGHSMGGAIAQLYALDYPEELRALILIGTGARLRVHPDYLKECEDAIQDNTQWLENREVGLEKVAPEIRKLLVQKSAEVGPAVQLNDFLCCDRFDVMDRIQEISLPTLVICGTEDVMTPAKFANYLADRIPGAQRRIFEGATHAVPLEQPDEVNKTIEEFLSGLPQRQA